MKIDRKAKVSDEIPSSSMADIAFLLLVFFLVTTAFSTEKGLQLQLPELQSRQVKMKSKKMLKLEVKANGQILVGYGTNRSPMKVLNIAPFVRGQLAERPELVCSIKTDDNAPYERMIDVLDELKKAGAPRIHFVPPREGG